MGALLTRRLWMVSAAAGLLPAQDPEFVCPMDPDMRSPRPGNCPRCGMKLVAGLPAPVEYPMEFRAVPDNIPAGRDVTFEFRVLDPKTGRPVTRFETVHEKLFHLFVVSHDLEYFSHEHPTLLRSGWFRLRTRLPKPGTYRLLADFAPLGGSPQLAAHTLSTAGFTEPLGGAIPDPAADLRPKECANVRVELTTDPPEPIAGRKCMLFYRITPPEGLERYLGAWAHLLAVSNDLVDAIHSHPFLADGGPAMQFNLFFPRAAPYRLWIQTQRRGVVNTAAFTLRVRGL